MTPTANGPRLPRRVWCGLVFGLILASPKHADADANTNKLTPDQVRAKMARVRADLERRRKAMDRANPNRGKAPLASRRPASLGARSRPQEGPSYHFRAGESFAYSIEIEVRYEGSNQIERLAGTPYVNVKSVNAKGEAELFVIGKLENSTRRGEDAEEKVHPNRAVWLGSRVALEPSGRCMSKKDINVEVLPNYFRTLNLSLKQLIFPELPRSVPSVDDSSGNASLFVTYNRGSFGALGFDRLEGKATRAKHADLLDPSLVRLTHRVAFRTNPSVEPRVTIDYRASGRFDRDLGRLRDFDSTFRQEQPGDMPVAATVRVRSLAGEALNKAYARSLADWNDRPEELEPIEFRRIRVEAFLPTSLASARDARPGMAVYHLRGSTQALPDADNKYYLAEVIEADAAPNGKVKIRYKGSDEVLLVHPGNLAYPPSPEHPDRDPGARH